MNSDRERHSVVQQTDHAHFSNKAEAVANYFATGCESAQNVQTLIRQFCTVEHPAVLEFASGYGCVTRHLKNQFAAARIAACDIHNEALDFIVKHMNVPTVPSRPRPRG